ncbi:hypothetical protein KY495_16265 [Massilia sp. PAMC28688]|uniref:DUF6151 family protein n=1 Tax=Massilia sp. PAMC28688 TaxID=2861283 RepID=UPI001C6344CF|nr:DUF6151 family protein [Massilia sp. PAMC28688]QYF92303.1 hypothetical protein KY495_16265 [Massilia sp. PAMC28688]
MDRDLSCTCGRLRGKLSNTEQCTRIKCYCDDCQAFAVFLGKPEQVLDAEGGSDIVLAHPRQLSVTEGAGALACMSLSDKGMLRWYAACCNCPIGNTTRNRKLAFVGLSSAFVAATPQAMDAGFGPVRMLGYTEHAWRPVPARRWRDLLPTLQFGVKLLKARLSGSYRNTPFFDAAAAPVVAPVVLSPAERAALARPRP